MELVLYSISQMINTTGEQTIFTLNESLHNSQSLSAACKLYRNEHYIELMSTLNAELTTLANGLMGTERAMEQPVSEMELSTGENTDQV